MAPNCVNYKCKSRLIAKMTQATDFVCSYYNVTYTSSKLVCGNCLKKCMMHCKQMGQQVQNGQCVFDNKFRTSLDFIELLSDDEDNAVDVTSTLRENQNESPVSNDIETIFQNMNLDVKIDEQKKICQNFLNTQRDALVAKTDEVTGKLNTVDKNLDDLYKTLFRFDRQRKFQFDKEVNIVENILDNSEEVIIVDNNEEVIIVDNDEEVNIVDKGEEIIIVDNDKEVTIEDNDKEVTIVDNDEEIGIVDSGKQLQIIDITGESEVQSINVNLPPVGIPRRRILKSGDKVYANKFSLLHPWYEATVQCAVSETSFSITFCDNSENQVLSYNNLAYIHKSNVQYPIGSRVIAKFQNANYFYAGLIAEGPKIYNNSRYLIFFDDGYAQYACHENIRLVCRQSTDVSDDVHENVREFIKAYLDTYPDRPMVSFNKRQIVRTELDKKWYLAKVLNLDASLVQLQIFGPDYKHTEWVYRGSNRLGPIFDHINKIKKKRIRCTRLANVNKILNRPYVVPGCSTKDEIINIDNDTSNNLSSVVSKFEQSSRLKECSTTELIKIPLDRPKPVPYIVHQCSHFCLLWVQYNTSQTKNMNTLSIPLHFGFERHIVKNVNSEVETVMYTTPCGRQITSKNEIYNYLKVTGYGESQMTSDLFSFDHYVNPLAVFKISNCFKYINDLSHGIEFKPISVVNCLNDSIPPHITYITKYQIKPGVKMNLDMKSLCSCDCLDNCDDKTKCSCWQLTYESHKSISHILKNSNIGYSHRRLYEPVYSGIYECNINCKCLNSCTNRVVQGPLMTSLQIFLTEKKGWGVRTLADIPKGTFICTFVGEVNTEKEAEKDGLTYGDEYLADLDYIETVEEIKNGYETDVVESEDDNSSGEDGYNGSEDDEFNPSDSIKKNIGLFESSRMSLRQRNIQNTDGKHQLSKLNTKQSVETKCKSLRSYLDNDCSVYIVDARTFGNVGRYFNHSCDPNIFVQNVFVDTHDPRFPWVCYFALTNILAGTELCWNYSYVIGSVTGKSLKCYCNSKNCNGRLL